MRNLLLIYVSLGFVCSDFAQEIGFTNGEESHVQMRYRYPRTRIYKCPDSMRADHEDHDFETVWRCRCPEGHLYLRSRNACFLQYRRGPCSVGHYIHFADNSTMPECVVNPCYKNGLVPYNGTCHKIGTWAEGPCKFDKLEADPETFKLRCNVQAIAGLSIARLMCPEDRYLNDSSWKPPSTWKCECPQIDEVYFPEEKKCYKPYRQGPCRQGHYVYLAINETIPQCVVNPCAEDRLVPYQGKCYDLGVRGKGPCSIGELIVDPTDMQLKCLDKLNGISSVFNIINCPWDTRIYNTFDDIKNWKCSCRAENQVYVQSSYSCYPVYRQGPCPSGHYVYLAINETVPRCVVNPCSEDGLVPYNGSCHRLGIWGEGPCNFGGLVTDQETYQLKCIDKMFDPYWGRSLFKCPDHRILNTYNSEDASTWKCECQRVGDVYFPSKNECYQLYRQGPCSLGQYVYLASNEAVPQCMDNPCLEDGLVSYNGTCHKLGVWGEGPCNVGGLVVDPSTLQLKCIDEVTDRSSLAELIKCPGNMDLRGIRLDDLKHWTCTCRGDDQVYFQQYNGCYSVYQQGPCPQGHYVYLAIKETVPQCVVNPCSGDREVPYNGTCHEIGSHKSPCGERNYLKINTSTFQLVCPKTDETWLSLPYHLLLPDSHCPPNIPNDPTSACFTIRDREEILPFAISHNDQSNTDH